MKLEQLFVGIISIPFTISFSIDHKVPMKNLKTREEVMDESNMVISCHDCNQAKGTKSYVEFING